MKIKNARFIRGVVGPDDFLEKDIPQIAFIGRSNVGKSSVINSLTHQKDLAITSSLPGRTQQINLFLINESIYLLDLPGYGFSQDSQEGRERLQKLIFWYLFESTYKQKKVVLIMDVNVGLTESDLNTLKYLREKDKNIVIVANKIDKMKKSQHAKVLKEIKDAAGGVKIIPYSAKKKIGVEELTKEVMEK
ncbi:MAG: ribosome biogenesis GTP-binding protein YihA/YsxC [Minisyncoccota bacterium]